VGSNLSYSRPTGVRVGLPHHYPVANNSAFLQTLRFAIAICICLIMVGGAFSQLQMVLFGGFVPITPAIFKAGLLLVFAVLFFSNDGVYLESRVLQISLLLLLLLVARTVYISSVTSIEFRDLLQSDFLYYFLPLAACCAAAIEVNVPTRFFSRPLLGFFVVSLCLGVAQYVSNEPIVRTESVDGNFIVLAWKFYGQVRAFALFLTCTQFGVFCCLIGSYGIVEFRQKSHKTVGVTLYLSAALGVAVSLTRTAQLAFALVTILTFVALAPSFGKRARLLPVISQVGALLLLLFGLSRLGAGNSYDLTSSETFTIRILEWTSYLGDFSRLPLMQQIFGAGLIQFLGDNVGRVRYVSNATQTFMDNTLLAVLMNTGLMGVVLIVALYVSAWQMLCERMTDRSSSLYTATLIMVAAIPFIGFFDLMFTELGVFLLLAFCLDTRTDAPVNAGV
jgi:hypothetical protein